MVTVALHGYYGFGNVGDEALLRAIVRDLRAQIPGARIVALSADPRWTARVHGLPAVRRFDPVAVTRLLRQAELFVLGGGTLLQDATSLRSLAYYAATALLARRLGCRVMLYANGLGPIATRLGRRLARAALLSADRITLRDGESLRLYAELVPEAAGGRGRSANRPRAPEPIVTADPVFGLADEGPPPDRAGDPYAVFAFRPWPPLSGRLSEIAAAARALAEERGAVPVFLAMHPRQDLALAERLAHEAGSPAHALALDPADVDGHLRLLAGARVLVTMRLHALLLAAAQGRPAVALPYDPKVSAAARELGLPVLGSPSGLPPAADLARELQAAVQAAEAAGPALRARLPELRRQAKRNAQVAAELAQAASPRRGRLLRD